MHQSMVLTLLHIIPLYSNKTDDFSFAVNTQCFSVFVKIKKYVLNVCVSAQHPFKLLAGFGSIQEDFSEG